MLIEGCHRDFAELCTRTDALRLTDDHLQRHLLQNDQEPSRYPIRYRDSSGRHFCLLGGDT